MAGLWTDPYRTIELPHRDSDSTGLVGKEGYAVAVDGSGDYTLAATGGTDFEGVCTSGGIAATDKCGAARGLINAAVIGAAVTAGDALTLDSSSRFITATGTTRRCGIALQSGGAAGELIRVYVAPEGLANDELTLAAAAEISDVIAITVTGRPLGEYVIEGYEATMIEAVAAALTLAETGAGAEVTTTANARLVITLSAAGVATVSATDVGGGSSKTFQMLCYPTDGQGRSARLAITFDGS
jgi:hypothetical protein